MSACSAAAATGEEVPVLVQSHVTDFQYAVASSELALESALVIAVSSY